MIWKHHSAGGRSVTQDKDGNIWAAAYSVSKLDESTGIWTSCDKTGYRIYDMHCDAQGRICVSTYGQTYIWNGSSWEHVAGRTYSVDLDENGTFWLAGCGISGVQWSFGKVEGTIWTNLARKYDNFERKTLKIAPDGKIWTNGDYGEIEEYDPATSSWTGNTATVSHASHCWAIDFDKDGAMWTKWTTWYDPKGYTVFAKDGVAVKTLGGEGRETMAGATCQNHTIRVDELNNKWMGCLNEGEGLHRYTGD
jgi:hypothetical protein